jgi:holo-[acyl-carrier protein] synthase
MIIGTGHDLVDIRRIEKLLDTQGERFLERCFTAEEIALAEKRKGGGLYATTLAKRFAAKEACAKALGCGIGEFAALNEIGVVHSESGRPEMLLTGAAAERLAAIVPEGMRGQLHVSLSDEYPYASAFVVIDVV